MDLDRILFSKKVVHYRAHEIRLQPFILMAIPGALAQLQPVAVGMNGEIEYMVVPAETTPQQSIDLRAVHQARRSKFYLNGLRGGIFDYATSLQHKISSLNSRDPSLRA